MYLARDEVVVDDGDDEGGEGDDHLRRSSFHDFSPETFLLEENTI